MARKIDHQVMHIDTVAMRVFVADRKVLQVRKLTKKFLRLAHLNRRRVSMALPRPFFGVCVSLKLVLQLARFFTRSILLDMSREECEECRKTSAGSTADSCTAPQRGAVWYASLTSRYETSVSGPHCQGVRVRICSRWCRT